MNARRIIAGLLMIALALALTACGQGKPAPTLPPLDEGIPDSSPVYTENQAPRETKNYLYEEQSTPLSLEVFDLFFE